MRKTTILIICLLLLAWALPASAAGTSIRFNDANNTTVTAITHTFKGTIATGYLPQDLSFRFMVYRNADNVLIDQSSGTRPVIMENGRWAYSGNTYTNNFSFTPDFGTNYGQLTVTLEAWNGSTLVATRSLQVEVLPIRLTPEQTKLTVTASEYRFAGRVTSPTTSLTASFKVLDSNGHIISRSDRNNPVTFGAWTVTGSQRYSSSWQFTAGFGEYTGKATVVVELSDGENTVSQTIDVTVRKNETTEKAQSADFKNRGQLVSYFTQQLKAHGHGQYKNHGQALNYCLGHPDFAGITTKAQADQFIARHINNNTATARNNSKK